MYLPDQETLARVIRDDPGVTVIPLCREIPGDLETPITVYGKLARGEHSFLLESAEGAGRVARYSFVGYDPILVIKVAGGKTAVLSGNGGSRTLPGDPLAAIRGVMAGFRLPEGEPGGIYPRGWLPTFFGGAVGYLGHDVVRSIERLPDPPPAEPALPDALLMIPRRVVAFDHLVGRIKLIYNLTATDWAGGPQGVRHALELAVGELDAMGAALAEGQAAVPAVAEPVPVPWKSSVSQEEFLAMVARAKEYVRAGEAFQVVLSQRLERPLTDSPLNVYRRLRSLNPSPYMFFMQFPELCLVGSSPEVLVRCRDGVAMTRPLAGTRPRGVDPEEDTRLARELLADEKERAEHVMLVDLGRNDLGRVCRYGTVAVTELLGVEHYSHVMHIVSEVEGRVRPEVDALGVLAACFPAGTLTGAPKVRAMEIIDELEPLRRGPYGGAVGYLGFDGNLDTCITIRTIVIHGNRAFAQAGAGIVHDSVPAAEYEETLRKASALLRALGAENPLPGGKAVVQR